MAMLNSADNLSSLYNEILNRIIWSDKVKSTDELRVNRSELAERIVKSLVELFNDKKWEWKGSEYQLYFHHLRESIQNFTPFNLCEIDNIVYQSLAAFILKGDDFDSLMVYMEANAISDYQYALGLWGSTLGYVQMPKRIIDKNIRKKSFEVFYKDMYSLLFRKQYKGMLEKTYTEQLKNESCYLLNNSKKSELMNFANEEIKGKDKKALIDSLSQILKRYDRDIEYDQILNDLLKEKEWVKKDKTPKTAWEKIQKRFTPNYIVKNSKSKMSVSKDKIGDLFNMKKHFYEDEKAWFVIEGIIPENNQESIKNDLTWIQKQFCMPYDERYEHYRDIDEKNDALVIEKFCNLKKNKINYFTTDLRERVKLKLLEYYGCK